ncbi:molybdopterin molybdotransferase MoeA [Kocuria massiliensis]|uniref:molybdopterin molybdotransferase MoeA n=1 Tax=Kocuria massiliensis TaxID=1926282 RepID=UPI0022B99C6F|nr:molybdopterin molybdotransferase MoeA [Kocuria massiliensis]
MRRTWDEAREGLYATATRLGEALGTRSVGLHDAMGMTLAEPVYSPMPVPHFDSSAMDGYAVAGPPPWRLLFAEHRGSGTENLHRRTAVLSPRTACPVLTGSVLPEGTEGILRSEHARLEHDSLTPLPGHEVVPGRDMRRTGEELPRGSVLLPAGQQMGPRQAAHLAACGVDDVTVKETVPVSVALTGNEVIELGVPGPGEVRDAFAMSLPTILAAWGGAVSACSRLHDDEPAVRDWVSRAPGRLVLVTGGSGGSGQDFARRVIEDAGADVIASSVEIRPGHPTLIAELADGRIVLGLPGNPLAAYTALYSFAPVALAGLYGRPLPPVRRARISEALGPLRQRTLRLIPCTHHEDYLVPLPKVQSHMLSGLAAAEELALIPREGVEAGDVVRSLPLGFST